MPELPEIAKETALATLAVTNGALYYAIPIEGLRNLKQLFQNDSEQADLVLKIIAAEACVVYTLFVYNTFKNISFRIDSLPKLACALFTPFAAAPFFTAGKNGSEKLYGNSDVALAFGVLLYVFRALTFLDGALKFPAHFPELLEILNRAYQEDNYAEIARISFSLVISAGFSVAITDSVYSAAQSVADRPAFSMASAILGMLGTFPLASYGIYRGMREITAAENDPPSANGIENGQRPVVQTDKYTWYALGVVFPSALGALGSATSATGEVFGRAGYFSNVARVIFSILYAIFMGTPAVSRFLRDFFAWLCPAEQAEIPAPPEQITQAERKAKQARLKRWQLCKIIQLVKIFLHLPQKPIHHLTQDFLAPPLIQRYPIHSSFLILDSTLTMHSIRILKYSK